MQSLDDAPEPVSGKRSQRIHFHVLDDEPEVARLVAYALTRGGLTGCAFTDPARFMARTAESPPDLVVLDLSLGSTDASEIMLQLEALAFRGRVLLMSGWAGTALRAGASIGRSCGLTMLEPLPKPFRLADLYRRVDEIVRICAGCGIAAETCSPRG